MTQMSRIDRGQPVEACQAAQVPADKWALLDALSLVAKSHGLTHRSLSVLRALMSFYPDRILPSQPGAGVVYPSNRVLGERLNGMPESTLRRHLAALVKSGLVARKDSANRKRFARFGSVSFGFDLSPLARAADDLLAAAHAMRLETQKIASLRARIAATRQELLDQAVIQADNPLIEHTRLCLRRQLPVVILERLADRLDDLRPRDMSDDPAEEMSGSDNRNERHIQTTEESISVIRTQTDAEPDLTSVAASCSEYKVYFPDTRPEWDSLVNAAERLHGMLGIDTPVYRSAQNVLGQRAAATTVLCMLETINNIRKPGAYLRTLVKRAGQGTFNISGLLHAARTAGLSADNLASG